MSVLPFYSPKFRAFDANGDPLVGGKLYTYAAATDTPQATYTTREGNVSNANPVVLDANGEANVWLTPEADYKFELRNSAGVVQWTVDNVPSGPNLLPNGTVAAPGLVFASDPDTGMYRIGANNAALAAGGVKALEWSATGTSFPLGITVTQSQANTNALSGTGNGTGSGVQGTGGATSAPGVGGVGGAPNGPGVSGTGTGSGPGVTGTGGATDGSGLYGQGTGAGAGVFGVGGTTGPGAAFTPGSATEAAIELGGSNPASTSGFTNSLTKANAAKAWVNVAITAGSPAVVSGFNIASVAIVGNNLQITLAAGVASSVSNMCPTVSARGLSGYFACVVSLDSVTQLTVGAQNNAGTALNLGAGTSHWYVHLDGLQ